MNQEKNPSTQDPEEKPKSGHDPKSSSLHQNPTQPMRSQKPAEMDDASFEMDEGPRPGPVDEIQAALFEAAQADMSTDVDFEKLAKPMPQVSKDEPASLDEVQAALLEASRANLSPDVAFETLPPPRKVIKSRSASRPVLKVEPSTPVEAEPQPVAEWTEPEPAPTLPDFWLILALFVVFRALTLLLLRPGGFIRDWSDFNTFFGIAALSDYSLYPFLDFWLEWPPLIPWLAVGAYRLALFLPPWPDDPRLWFILIFGGIFVLFEIGNFILIYRLARRLFQSSLTVSRVLWLYAGLFPPIYAMLGFFDGVVLFFMLLALDFLLQDRRFLSAITVGIGIMIKLVPILILPVALKRLLHQYQANQREARIEAGLYAVVAGLTVLVLIAPFLILGPEWVLASTRSMLGRSPWETIWALIEGYYGFGVVLGDRLNPAETNFAIYPALIPWWLITLAFLGLYLYLFTRPADYGQPRNLLAFGGLTVIIFLLYSKGYSPQFLVYLLPFILLLMPDGRGVTYALVLTGLNVLEQPVYFVLLPEAEWLLTFAVLARFGVMLILALEFAFILWPVRLASLVQVRQYAPLALGGLAALALVILTPLTLKAYSDSRLANSPVGTFAGFMETQLQAGEDKPRLLLSQQETYQQLYPYLHERFDIQLSGGATRFPGADTSSISDLLQGLDQVWILPTGPQEAGLRNTVSGRGELLSSYDFEGLGTVSLYSFGRNPLPAISLGRFPGGMELLAYTIEPRSGQIKVTLYWRATSPQTQPKLTVFTHLLNEEGEWIAGHDGIPGNGTTPVTEWPVGAVQADSHLILLPPDLPPGNYLLAAGLRVNDERLVALAPDGSNYPDGTIALEVIRLP